MPIVMKKIRMLRVSFDTEIRDVEIPSFRSAIIEKVGKDSVLFHHHIDEDKYLYKYPLIQYKSLSHQPTIICIDLGVDEIHKYFEKKSWDIRINDRKIEMKIATLELNQFVLQVWNKMFTYTIHNWIALNQDNLKKYSAMASLTDRISFLEKTLIGNILSFAKGVEWTVDKQIDLKIVNFKEPRTVKIKSNDLIGFNVEFNTNTCLPNHIGLGKAVSKGYGIIRVKKNNIE
jgi:hypothetical protein